MIRKCVSIVALVLASVTGFSQKTYSGQAESGYSPAPLSAIKPAGWLFQQLNIMRNGSSGHLDEIYDKIKDDNGWLGGKGDGWEETPYWLDGATPLAYLLDDKKLQNKVLRYINWTIEHQRPSGYFGPVTATEIKTGKQVTAEDCEGGEDWWPKMVMLKTLQQYYSATADKRVIGFMTRYFNYQLNALKKCPVGKWTEWSRARGVENLMMVSWLYSITKERSLIELENILSKQSFSWSKWFEERTPVMQAAAQQNDIDIMWRHSVNVAMGLKEPSLHYARHKDRKYADIQKTAFNDLMLLHGLPMGIFSGDEDLHGNNLSQGTELCTIVETMYSLEKMIDNTGDVQYMDALERLAFNALPAQTTDDYNMKQYFQIPNQVQVARGALEFSVTQFDGMSNVFGTKSGYTCCYANMHQGWTKFAAQLWHRSKNGIATLTYAPSEFRGRIGNSDIHIREMTDYPFDERISFRISTDKNISFPWQLRIPAWCKQADILLNGKLLRSEKGGQIITINRTWKNDDEIVLHFPMEVTVSNWAKNSRVIERGPLVYALKIKEQWEKGHHEIAGDYFSVYPATDWNYGIVQKAVKDAPAESKISIRPMPAIFTWNLDNAPIQITVPAKKLPTWKLTDGILHQPVSDRSGLYQGLVSDSIENIILIPYGCTKLRIVGFPVVK